MAIIFSQTPASNTTTDTSRSYRHVCRISAGALDQIRVTLTGHTTSTSQLDHVSIGISASTDQGATIDTLASCTATPVELLFGGVSGVTMTSGDNIKSSDWLNFNGFTSSNFLVVIIDVHSTNGNGRELTGLTGFDVGGPVHYGLKAATASYNVQASSGFTSFKTSLRYITTIETQSAGGGASNLMGVRSRAQLDQ